MTWYVTHRVKKVVKKQYIRWVKCETDKNYSIDFHADHEIDAVEVGPDLLCQQTVDPTNPESLASSSTSSFKAKRLGYVRFFSFLYEKIEHLYFTVTNILPIAQNFEQLHFFWSAAWKQNGEHVQHTFFCQALDVFLSSTRCFSV